MPGIRDAVAFPVPEYSWSSPRWWNRGSEIQMPVLKSQLLLQKLYPATANDLQLLEKPGVPTDEFLQPSEEVSTQNDGEEIRGEPDLLPPMRELE